MPPLPKGWKSSTKTTRSDVVYTPSWVAKDMVEHFQPNGVILDPCKGRGVFLDYLPSDAMWCEISEGRDFFQWTSPVNWVISNPPYSLTRPWLRHSYKVAENIAYLVPYRNITSGYGLLAEMREYGWMKHVRVYGTGGKLGFPMGNAIVAIHVQRGYSGDTGFSFFSEP